MSLQKLLQALDLETAPSSKASNDLEPDAKAHTTEMQLAIDKIPGRLLALQSQGGGPRYYVLPQCQHDDDTVYPHNRIKEANDKSKCISDVRSRNLCMLYRM